jgi:tripartite-type tricarboxylate transporter receptor subunit TctC
VNALSVLVTVASAAFVFSGEPAGAAESFPSRPIRLFIPFVPGGSTDFVARVLQPGLVEELGQPVVLDNRPGASGNIAVELAARATPDGYTLLFGNVGTIAINPALFKKLSVQPLSDLACVNIAANVSSMLVAHPSLPVRSLKEFIDYAKARPGKITWGTSSYGSPATLGMQYLAHKSGLEMVMVAYKGAGNVTTALLSSEVVVAFVAVPPTLSFVRGGQLRALAVRGATRFDSLPDVPTISEAGFPELTSDSWQGIFAPAKTPATHVARVSRAASKALKDPKVIEQLKTAATTAMDIGDAKNCAAFVKSEASLWSGIAQQVGMRGTL